ncbi:ABC transporter permease [Salinisphaera sp. Q1T1-3]|uniref:ABC transporter permease n=1 Tax=Salinisphaera sp. Q1T1-3 TaxID=2321229 RepID=UPI000E771555|nr:ABC transporter permease [Salinisphaera sp. Q1T1-3]RJS91486.1 ABC transporter permease [Salinisphaera sp. Q1T1-3]
MATPASSGLNWPSWINVSVRELLLVVGVIVITAGISIGSSGNFWAASNLTNLMISTAITLVPAIGMTVIIVTGGIDVSVGSMLGLVAVAGGTAFEYGLGLAAATPVFLIAGAILGLINGALITYGRVPPVIATLGTLSVYRAAAFLFLGNHWITMIPPSVTETMVLTQPLGVPVAVWIALVLLALGMVFLARLPRGRHIFAIGNNENAARLNGIPVERIKLAAYTLTGVLVGVAALMSLGHSPMVQTTTGTGFELTVIAAVVLGGTELTGGRGSLLGTLLGAILVGLVQNGVVLLHIQPFWSGVVLGVIILVSVGSATVRRND